MDMKGAFRCAALALLVTFLTASCVAQLEHSIYNPGARQKPSRQKSSLFDFVLNRINPDEIDYGKRLSEERAMLLDASVNKGYFWSNVVAIGFLAFQFMVIVYQHQTQVRRDHTAAETLATYEHALARANEQVEHAGKANKGLKETLTALRESALRSSAAIAARPGERPQPAVAVSVDPSPSSPPAARDRGASNSPKPTRTRAATAPADASSATDTANQMGLFASDADLIMRINSLEQQLAQSQEESKQLRRRLSDGDRKLDVEQARNRQLKGA
jgi:hypothetical protein